MKSKGLGNVALRLLVVLCTNNRNGSPMRLKDVAENAKLSLSYLERAASTLKTNGYIRGTRGPGGGYVLSPKYLSKGLWELVSVGEILALFEGAPHRTKTMVPPDEIDWLSIDEAMRQDSDAVTVGTLVKAGIKHRARLTQA